MSSYNVATNFEKCGIKHFYFFCPNVYHTWYSLGDTLVYIGTLNIFIRLCVCMPNNINKHRPRIIKFAHNLSYKNGLNGRCINIYLGKFIYENYTYYVCKKHF